LPEDAKFAMVHHVAANDGSEDDHETDDQEHGR
jgi:hypothetical protein